MYDNLPQLEKDFEVLSKIGEGERKLLSHKILKTVVGFLGIG